MKNSFTFLEIILSILISTIVIINTAYFSKELFQTNQDIQKIEILKLDLLSTKIFLQKNSKDLIKNLNYKNKTLFFKSKILLKNVDEFTIEKKVKNYVVFIKVNNSIEEKWNILL